jgi:hypothetical protein
LIFNSETDNLLQRVVVRKIKILTQSEELSLFGEGKLIIEKGPKIHMYSLGDKGIEKELLYSERIPFLYLSCYGDLEKLIELTKDYPQFNLELLTGLIIEDIPLSINFRSKIVKRIFLKPLSEINYDSALRNIVE